MRMALCIFNDSGDKIIARSEDLYCEIDSDMATAMKDNHGLDLYKEVGQLMVHEMKKQLTTEEVLEMIKEALNNEN